MSIDTQTAPIADTPAVNNNNNNNNDNNDNGDNTINSNTNSNDRNGSSSPSKNRRRRRRNKNKNKNNNNNNNNNNDNKSIKSKTNKPKTSNKEKNLNQQTKLHLNRKSKKKNPWQKVNNSSTFENIMKQQTKINQNPIYNDTQIPMNEEDILEQQMILQAIAESNKLQKQQETETMNTNKNKDDEKKQEIDQQNIDNNNNNNKNEEDEKQIIEKTENNNININDELIAATINAQSDEMLAIQLQQQEQKELLRRQKMSKIYDGKYAKVTSSSSHPTAIPKAALNFYYDDTSMLNGGLTKEQYQDKLLQIQSSEESIIDRNTENTENVEIEQETVAISKHDAKIWSETHMNRLNEYETGGDLNTNMNIGNQAYNAFRNQLDKKGYISYHNYQLEPKDKKR